MSRVNELRLVYMPRNRSSTAANRSGLPPTKRRSSSSAVTSIAAAEAAPGVGADAVQAGAAGQAPQSLHLLLRRRIARRRVQPQDFAQGVQAFRPVLERQVVERQVRHQPPQGFTPGGRRTGRRGLLQQHDAGQRSLALDPQPRAGRHLLGQGAVGAERLDRHGLGGRQCRLRVQVQEADRHVRAGQVRPARQVAVDGPERLGPIDRGGMVEGEERPVFQDLPGLDVQAGDGGDAVHLRRPLAPVVADDAVFGLPVLHPDRLGHLGEQVRHRRAAQREASRADREALARRHRQQQQHVQRLAAGQPGRDGARIDEAELLREAEILVHQPIGLVGVAGMRQHGLVRLEPDRAQRRLRRHDAAIPARPEIHDPLHAGQQQLLQGVGLGRVAVQIQPQGVDGQLAERRVQGVQPDAEHRRRVAGVEEVVRVDRFHQRLADPQWPERQVVTGPEAADHVALGAREELRRAGQQEAGAELALRGVDVEPGDRQGGHRVHQMGLHQAEQARQRGAAPRLPGCAAAGR